MSFQKDKLRNMSVTVDPQSVVLRLAVTWASPSPQSNDSIMVTDPINNCHKPLPTCTADTSAVECLIPTGQTSQLTSCFPGWLDNCLNGYVHNLRRKPRGWGWNRDAIALNRVFAFRVPLWLKEHINLYGCLRDGAMGPNRPWTNSQRLIARSLPQFEDRWMWYVWGIAHVQFLYSLLVQTYHCHKYLIALFH